MKVSGLTGPAKEAVLDGRVRFSPERWQRPFVNWLDNLRDWNISRQLWWGHRIPAWYCPDGHVTVAVEDPAGMRRVRAARSSTQDPDVLDTWFSSQLWPYSTLGWPDATPELDTFYPNEALVTGYEILYLWVARMVMSGLFLVGDVPFRNAVIHGLVRDGHGRKMSKSLGNVIDPIEMIDRYGADALRFALSRTATGGQQDIPLSEDAIEAGRNFANKIWNASRLVLRAFPGGEPQPAAGATGCTVAERWLLSRHQACLQEVDAALDEYRFADAAQALHRFTWSELCDWGLELEKGRLEGTDQEARGRRAPCWRGSSSARCGSCIPSMPFVTEEIWQRFGVGESIAIAALARAASRARRRGGRGLARASCRRSSRRSGSSARSTTCRPRSKLDVTVGVPDAEQPVLAELSERIGRMIGLGSMTIIAGDSPKADGHRAHRRDRRVRGDPGRRDDRPRRGARAPVEAPRRARPRHRAVRDEARERGVPRQGRARGRGRRAGQGSPGSAPSATRSSRSSASWAEGAPMRFEEALAELEGRKESRMVPDLARILQLAHAPGRPAAVVSHDPRDRHERQDHDGARDHGARVRARHHDRAVHVAAPASA